MGTSNSKAVRMVATQGAVHEAVETESNDISVVIKKTSNINEKYTLGNTLGRGQFGVTHMAVDKENGEEYAVKSIPKKNLVSERDIHCLKQEVTIMHLLAGHPDIIDVKAVYEDEHNVHIVMELCTGGELFDSIVERGNYTEKDAAQMVKTMLEIVAHCHDFGVVHRDLKPENFLLSSKDPSASLKLIDFGVSEFCENDQYLTDMVGSLYYIPPEVLKRRYSFPADIWSIGIITYILLCGEPPFHCDTNVETFKAILESEIDFSFDPWPCISSEAKDCVLCMLERNPERRGSARKILQHEWLMKLGCGNDKPLDNAVFKRMHGFTQGNRLKRVALKLIATQLPEEETQGLRTIFKSIDKDGNGTLTIDELQEGLNKRGANVEELELLKLMQKIDLDENGEIDYEEFLAANVQLRKLDSDQNMRYAFKLLDKDGNGFITRDEIMQCLTTEQGLTQGEVDDVLQEVDVDGDGRINYMEFLAMMQQGDAHASLA